MILIYHPSIAWGVYIWLDDPKIEKGYRIALSIGWPLLVGGIIARESDK